MVKVNRWITLAAGCLIQASSGLNYSFSILAPLFKARFGYDDMQLATVAVAINLGGYLAILSGYAYDLMAGRHNLGPRVIIWVGCVLMSVGYGAMWAQVRGTMVESYSRMLLYAFVAGNASTWWDTSALVTNVRNFPDDRGSVMGILKAFVGISTSIYASIYWALFAAPPALPPPSRRLLLGMTSETVETAEVVFIGGLEEAAWLGASDSGPLVFLGFLAIVPSTLNLLGSLFINHVPLDYHEPTISTAGPSQPHPHPHHHHLVPVNKSARFTSLYVLVAVVAVLQAGCTLAGQGQPAGSEVDKVHALVLVVLLGMVLLIPASTGPFTRPSLRKQQSSQQQQQQGEVGYKRLESGGLGEATHAGSEQLLQQEALRGRDEEALPLLQQSEPGMQVEASSTDDRHGNGNSSGEEDKNEAPPLRNLTPGQALCRGSFWALFVMFLSGCACGLTLLNNLGPLVISLGGVQGGQVAFVSLFSVANASGRLLFGHLSEFWLHKSGVPRTIFLLIASSLMAVCMAVLAAGAPLPLLYLLSLAIGLAFGGHWSAIPAVASDLFGLQSFAGIYCILQGASAIGALVFASYLCGLNLQQEAERQGSADCVGLECFQETWVVLLGVQCAAVGVGVWLWSSTRVAYRRSAAEHKPQQQVSVGRA